MNPYPEKSGLSPNTFARKGNIGLKILLVVLIGKIEVNVISGFVQAGKEMPDESLDRKSVV